MKALKMVIAIVNIAHKLNMKSGSSVALDFLTLLQKKNGHTAISIPKRQPERVVDMQKQYWPCNKTIRFAQLHELF